MTKRAPQPDDRMSKAPASARRQADATPSWEERLAELVLYKKIHGPSAVPPKRKGSLGSWLAAQCSLARRSEISKVKIRLLTELGIDWATSPRSLTPGRFQELEAFKAAHGHCNVPVTYPGGLGAWAARKRYEAKVGRVSQAARSALDAIGFPWDHSAIAARLSEQYDSRWQVRAEELEAFHKKYGHCYVPNTQKNLYAWTQAQRSLARKANYPPNRRARLDRIAFDWDSGSEARALESESDQSWRAHVDDLVAFKAAQGHLDVPEDHPGGLARWLRAQRHLRHANDLSADREATLQALGVSLQVNAHATLMLQADMRIEELRAYKAANGDCNVPYDFPGGLGRWVATQRERSKRDSYPKARRATLDGMGFLWNGSLVRRQERDAEWAESLALLQEFAKANGHCRPPASTALGAWVGAQRGAAKLASYPADRRAKLDAIGFDWSRVDVQKSRWEAAFRSRMEELERFKSEHGHCNVPTKHPGGLGAWLITQRSLAQSKRYPKERRAQLQAAGFSFISPQRS